MHHQDFSGEPPGAGSRKSGYHFRRGSSGASASAASGATTVNTDDSPAQTGSSSPALHHQAQSQVPGAQVKKKSGFQITSVTSAQINVSGNNSLADDTESYDDMDESHTEDLSSSDMLDVSVSKATDTGVPERSSSDETLNSLHGVDTPGLVSPNEPLHAHSIPQGSQSHSSMVNGSIHPPYYSQQHSQSHHHHSDSLGGGETPLPSLPVAPLATSSPAMISKGGTNQSQRPLLMDNTQSSGGTTKPLTANISAATTDAHLQGSVNISNISAVSAPAAPSSGPAGFDTNVSGQVTGPSAPANNSQTQHTQTATGSRFRVVKLDTNSEPFRKGRWTCTEYYEKEIPPAASSETPKGTEGAVETEAGNTAISQGLPMAQPPHTLQPYPPLSQDFTSPQAMQSPPQGVGLTTPLTYVSPQEVIGGVHMQKPVAPITVPTATPQGATQVGLSQPLNLLSQQLPYAVDPLQAHPQGGYSATQLHAGVMSQGTVRQPDFIQPTAPFQTQVQPPLTHIATGIPVTPGPGVTGQASSVGLNQHLSHQSQVAPLVQSTFSACQPPTIPAHPQQQHHPQTQAQPVPAPIPGAPTQVTQGIPLTALHADLQPLLAPGTAFTQIPGGGSSVKTSQLEDAQRLLLQHQSLLGLPRLGTAPGGEGSVEAHSAAGTLAHMGMSVEASAFMAVAAAGLRSQHVEGEEDSSSGASVVAIDNKIEQAMDLVKSHLMYAVREEVEVLKEQIKELIERNTQLEQENNLLKNLASPEQMAQFQAQVQTGGSPTSTAQPPVPGSAGTTQVSTQNSGMSA